jgi:glutamine transport system substrate-binding protein
MKRIAALIMGFVLMTVLVAPASAKELVVAHDTNFMPFEFKGPDGKFTGFDIELWETIAKKLGLSYKFQPMDFNGIIPGLQTGNVDVGIAGMTITPERAKVVQFSNGYYTSGLKILVRDDEKGISKVEDLAGKVVAVKTGTSSVPFMKDFGKAKELKQFPNNDGMFFELLSKGVDAVVFDMPVVTAFANSAGKGKAKVVGPLYEGQKYGIGFAQGNEELVKKVNGVLDQMRKDGSYAKKSGSVSRPRNLICRVPLFAGIEQRGGFCLPVPFSPLIHRVPHGF